MTYIIGLTGTIATGKSTVGKELRLLLERDGLLANYVDCDEIAHQVLRHHRDELVLFLKELLSQATIDEDVDNLLDDDGHIDRVRLGRLIFEHADLRKKWQRRIHGKLLPTILSQIWTHYSAKQWLPFTRQDVIVLDMPLLFETPHVRWFMKKIICVTMRDESTQLKRLLSRDPQLSETQAKQRMQAQMPSKEKEKLSDYLIPNDGTLDELKQHVQRVYDELKRDLKLR